MDLTQIRTDLEEFAQALAREEYLTRAGLKEESRAASIRDRFPALNEASTFQEVRAEAQAASNPEQARRLRFLAEVLGTNCVAYQARDLLDALATAEARQVISLEGERLPLRSAEIRIKNEADRPRRAALESARLAALADLNGLRLQILERSYEAAQGLGFPGYVTLCQELSGIDLTPLRDLTQPILSRTLDAYRERVGWFLRRVGVDIRHAQRHDLARLFRAPELDASLPLGALRQAAEAPVRLMHIDPSAGGRIRVDDEPRPTKTPRAFVAPLRVPDEIILVIRPAGGIDDAQAYLHELGHALHFGYTDPSLTVEERRLGDPSVTEAFAFLLDGLLRERQWLRRFAGIPTPGEILAFTALHKLWYLRRYTAKLAYELLLHAAGPKPRMSEAYREILSEAMLVDWPHEPYLDDLDPYFYAARYLRAWIFEAQLRELLRERFDEEWYRNDRTGPFLLELWRQGQRQRLEELAEQLGLGPPSLEPLLRPILADLS